MSDWSSNAPPPQPLPCKHNVSGLCAACLLVPLTDTRKKLVFGSIAMAVDVLGTYTTKARLEKLASYGFDLSIYRHKELAVFVCASREKVTRALAAMGLRKRVSK